MASKTKKRHKRGFHIEMRLLLAAVFILLQIGVVFFTAYFFAGKTIWVYALLETISIIIVIYIVNKRGNPSYKITWIIYILLFPLVGGLVYLFWGGGRVFPHVKKKMRRAGKGSEQFLKQERSVMEHLVYDDLLHARQAKFLTKAAGFPVYEGTQSTYLSPGETAFLTILEELKKAEKYIFIEFFILAEGHMWDEIFDILAERRSKGVTVRIIYDDFGSISRQYRDLSYKLANAGFEVTVFNKIRPSVDIFMNNRNHRKIIVIDGETAFTGGMNIGDEYINEYKRFGYWVDSVIMLKGAAVTSFTVMFLSMWGFCTGQKQKFENYIQPGYSTENDGFILPYCDGPVNEKNPAEGIYLQILNTAQRYVYIVTPYLIVDNTMLRELALAALSGIDVRIITPGIPDKKYVHPVTQYSYGDLLAAGVRIFEYTPGFVHSKIFVSDDKVGTVGTVNMDYRSFFFHFECGVWMCDTSSVFDMKDHFLQLQNESREINYKKWKNRKWYIKLKQLILHIFAPFM